MTNRAAPSDLWDLARTLLATLFDVFGEPRIIAACGAVGRKSCVWLLAWLNACEALTRRLLLIEARAMAAPPASCRQTPSAGKARAVRERFSLNPDDWRVRFRCTPGASDVAARRLRLTLNRGAPPAPARSSFRPALPLARRAEALRRVLNNPLAAARRLARLIARLPHAIARILAPPRERKARSGAPPNIIAIIGPAAWARLTALCADTG